MNAIERFWSKTRVDGNCLVWTGHRTPTGYGGVTVKRRPWRAHRWIYFQVTGVLPPVVMHTCDNPACVKVQHLEAGTHATNRIDAMNKRRVALGEKNGMAKLTMELAREIRRLHAGGQSMYSLAKQYGVSKVAIRLLIRGETWKDL